MTDQTDAPAEPPRAPTARRPALDRDVAMRLAATEYDRVTAQLASLSPEDWTRSSGCPPWDVRALAPTMTGCSSRTSSGSGQSGTARHAG